MSAIPELAHRVIEILRRDVPRPVDLPQVENPGFVLCPMLRWGGDRCAMGLHPKATARIPVSPEHLPGLGLFKTEITAFWEWWDEQADPQAAVDAVWGASA